MTIADELARERAARGDAGAPTSASAAAIDDLDSLDQLDTLDWSADPWDDAEAAGTVERLRVADPLGQVGRLHAARARDRR